MSLHVISSHGPQEKLKLLFAQLSIQAASGPIINFSRLISILEEISRLLHSMFV